MLVNLKEILAIAEERKCAVGAFNTPNPQDQLLHLHVQCGKPGGPGTSCKGRCDFLPRSRNCGAESNAGGCGEGDDCVYGS